MKREYPWYEVVESDELTQGDLLLGLPVPTPVTDLTFPLPEDDLVVDLLEFDVVVMTQSCDLAHDKITHVILCPHWDLRKAQEMDPALAKKGAPKEIIQGRRPRYLMLDQSSDNDLEFPHRIVDFGRIFSLPKDYVRQYAATLGKRLRLCPPYREHLAQAFARFFMRVGLPQDIRL